MQHKIDSQQFGNVKGISFLHYLVNLCHTLHQSVDGVNNMGTMVLMDFSKVFETVDHSILVDKYIRLWVRRSIVSYLSDFVRYNQTLSE